jgi:hypothetical protein
MKVFRGVMSKASSGRYFPLTYAEVKHELSSLVPDASHQEVRVELRNTVEVSEHGHLLLEYEQGYALTLFSVPDGLPATSASTNARNAIGHIFCLPALETSSRLQGCRRLYRAYAGGFGLPTLTEVSRVYSVGKYRGSDSLATASKPKLSRKSERRIHA